MLNKRTGQSTVEYIVLVTAVIAVAVAFFLAPNNQFQKTMTGTLSDSTTQIDTMNQRLVNAQALTNGFSPAADQSTPEHVICGAGQRVDPATGNCV